MPITEQYTSPPPAVVDLELRNQSAEVPFEASLPEEDPINLALREAGVRGRPVAEIQAGRQGFAIVDVSDSLQPNSAYYTPFTDDKSVKEGTPKAFELDTESPFLLVHFDGSGKVVGRAIRSGRAISIGRQVDDPKSRRFAYQDDLHLSRDHLSIVMDKNSRTISITDRNSTNGTHLRYMEGERTYTPSGEDVFIPTQPEAQPAPQPEQAKLTEEVVSVPEFLPKQEVICGDKKFYLSDIIRGGNRDKAILYAQIQKDGVNMVVPRLLYKSRSDGGWRAAYGIEEDGRYIKEAHQHGFAHYTQETKLDPLIVTALEKAGVADDPTHALSMRLGRVFSERNPNLVHANTADKEISYYESQHDSLMNPFRALSAGWLDAKTFASRLAPAGYKSFSHYFKSLDKAFTSLPGFLPDFTQGAQSVARHDHTLLGSVVVEDFPASFMGEPIVWSIGRDVHGRVWIDNIRLAHAEVSSYGNYKTIFDGGLLTNKPIEYISQSNGLATGQEAKDFDHRYQDITPLLAQLLPIRQYKQARGIA